MEKPPSLLTSDAKFAETQCVQLVKGKLSHCEAWADPFFTGSTTVKGRERLPISCTFLEHEVLHHGEGAHTLRHLLRGGNVVIVKPNPDRKSVKNKSAQSEESKSKEADDLAREKFYKNLKWGESIQKVQDLRQNSKSPCPYGSLFELESTSQRDSLKNKIYQPLTKIEHTNAQFYQVPSDEDGLADFESQLREECSFSSLLETSKQYPAILFEIAAKLGVRLEKLTALGKKKIVKELKGGAGETTLDELQKDLAALVKAGERDCDLIVWHRRMDSTAQNRIISKDQHESCQKGALLALGGQLNNDRVLHLGDGKCTDDANAYNVKGNKKNLFNLHSSGDRGGRTIFEQWLFMRAVVKLTGASLLVSERTGLSDLFALAGGIPICQFVPPTRDINPRLGQVFESGCGMGAAVWFQGKSNVDCTAMKLACETAVAEKKMLCEAICKKQSNEISSTEKCVSY